jgi:transcription initiation factor IIE alpha subunit
LIGPPPSTEENSAMQETATLYRNYYECSECGTRWTDEWDCQCNDRCPKCSCETEAYDSVEIIP